MKYSFPQKVRCLDAHGKRIEVPAGAWPVRFQSGPEALLQIGKARIRVLKITLDQLVREKKAVIVRATSVPDSAVLRARLLVACAKREMEAISQKHDGKLVGLGIRLGTQAIQGIALFQQPLVYLEMVRNAVLQEAAKGEKAKVPEPVVRGLLILVKEIDEEMASLDSTLRLSAPGSVAKVRPDLGRP
jgi:hypothetical protein